MGRSPLGPPSVLIESVCKVGSIVSFPTTIQGDGRVTMEASWRADPGPWEPWRVTARATQPSANHAMTRTHAGVCAAGRCRPPSLAPFNAAAGRRADPTVLTQASCRCSCTSGHLGSGQFVQTQPGQFVQTGRGGDRGKVAVRARRDNLSKNSRGTQDGSAGQCLYRYKVLDLCLSTRLGAHVWTICPNQSRR
jgi:hypothetical protein